jgi:ubiquinone/menaquinone biosynthesis C-methylase UbiE
MKPNHILAGQYQDSAKLKARIRLYDRFNVNPYGWRRWILEQIRVPAEARHLEIGCGPGDLWHSCGERISLGWNIVLSDSSAGMMTEITRNLSGIKAEFRWLQCEADYIPLVTQQFDAVVANHMLYHVEDIRRAIDEFRRVLKPAGILFATTNGRAHLHELVDLVAAFDNTIPFHRRVFNRFSLENGPEVLKPVFKSIEVRRYPDSIRVTEADAVCDYVLSSFSTFRLPEATKDALAAHIRRRIAEMGGDFTITKDTGMIVAQ